MLASEHSGKPARTGPTGPRDGAATAHPGPWHHHQRMRAIVKYFRANPQVFLLFLVCVVLGLGTFVAVLVALVQSGNTTPTGEPSGGIGAAGALVGMLGAR